MKPDTKSLKKVLSGAGGSIFNKTIGRLFGAGLPQGAEGPMAKNDIAKWTQRTNQTDWRVKLTLAKSPDIYNFFFGGGGKKVQEAAASEDIGMSVGSGGTILKPLADEGGVVFPLTPSVIIQHNANYTQLATTHANYPFYAYQNSEPANLTIVAEFPVQNQQDALYWVATLHFFRAVTKMFFGGDEGAHRGNPPPILQLNGYGNHVFKNIPVIVTMFTCELREGIDYISTSQMGADMLKHPRLAQTFSAGSTVPETWAPTQSLFTVQVQPVYSRETVKKFNMADFVAGKLQNKDGVGFI